MIINCNVKKINKIKSMQNSSMLHGTESSNQEMKELLKCLQNNLHTALAETVPLKKRFLDQNFDIELIQEPWTVKEHVKSLSAIHVSKSFVLFNNKVSLFPLTYFITKDVVAAVVDTKTEKRSKKTVFASAYFEDNIRAPS